MAYRIRGRASTRPIFGIGHNGAPEEPDTRSHYSGREDGSIMTKYPDGSWRPITLLQECIPPVYVNTLLEDMGVGTESIADQYHQAVHLWVNGELSEKDSRTLRGEKNPVKTSRIEQMRRDFLMKRGKFLNT
jgi:hypothetical protein